MSLDDVVIRHLSSSDDYEACVALERETWGCEFDDLVPAAVLMVCQKVGGLVGGAFDASGAMVGCVLSFAGFRDGEPAHWSHMLAVTGNARGLGLGRRLKEFQRREVLASGIERIYWTYDPLVARNAHLNLNRLGAEVIDFIPNMYGETGSPLHAGGQTDRFLTLWRLSSARARAASEGSRNPPEPDVLAAPLLGDPADPDDDPAEWPDDEIVRIAVPYDLEALLTAGSDEAIAWRSASRRAFIHYLERGYRVRGITAEPDDQRAWYWVERPSLPAPTSE